jgi:O-methyltransferase
MIFLLQNHNYNFINFKYIKRKTKMHEFSNKNIEKKIGSGEEKYLDLVKRGVMGSLDTNCSLNWSHTKTNSKENVNKPMSNSIRSVIGKPRLDNIQDLVCDIYQRDIPGDIIEAGCWRGGAAIFFKACMSIFEKGSFEKSKKQLYCADLFQSHRPVAIWKSIVAKVFAYCSPILPFSLKNVFINKMLSTFPQETYTKKTVDHLLNVVKSFPWTGPTMQFNTSLEDVKEAFRRYDLLDENVHFLQGWFSDTLPKVPTSSLSILRADGDFFTSTMQIFNNLYHKLEIGGYCIVDDYGAHPECTLAVDEFRKKNNITEEIIWIDNEAVYWKKEETGNESKATGDDSEKKKFV